MHKIFQEEKIYKDELTNANSPTKSTQGMYIYICFNANYPFSNATVKSNKQNIHR